MYTEGQLPRHTAATAYYGEEQEYTSSMDLAEKIPINLLFPDAYTFFVGGIHNAGY